MSKKQTYPRKDWLSNPDFKNWLKCKDSKAAFCVKCNKSIELSNIREQALRSHMKSKKHIKSTEPINVFFPPRTQPVITTTTEQSTVEPSVSTPPVYQKQLTLVLNSSSTEKRKAEFLWTLKCVRSDISTLSVEGVSELFEFMFSDSQIAKDFQMSRTTMTYLINFAIAPYFLEILICELKSCNYYSILLDESLNDITQTCQMDVHVRYCSSSKNQICVRYLDSKFMGHATGNDILENLQMVYDPSLNRRTSTNWKFFNLLQKDRVKKEQHNLIEIGSCSLHIIHGGFKTGAGRFYMILQQDFTILHGTPARREDYISITGEERFPLFFCATRWVEDTVVADRLIEIWDSTIKIVRYWEKLPKSKQSTSKSFLKVQEAVNDKFAVAKFQFLSFVGSLFKPFLTKYQTSWPMLPYLYDDLTELIRNCFNFMLSTKSLRNVKQHQITNK